MVLFYGGDGHFRDKLLISTEVIAYFFWLMTTLISTHCSRKLSEVDTHFIRHSKSHQDLTA